MSDVIRIFVGSGSKYRAEERVFIHTVLRNASRPVEIDVIDGDEHCVRRFGCDVATPLPDAWRGCLGGATSFSFARYGPPELCGFRGRAIYCESDQLVVGDVAELWDLPLDGAAFAAVPSHAVRGGGPTYQRDGYLSSVMLMDAERCRTMSVSTIFDDVRSDRLEYTDVISMTKPCLDALGLRAVVLPGEWNDIEHLRDDTKLLHFTHKEIQPWLVPGHPAHDLWRREFLACCDEGLLGDDVLDSVRRLDGISARTRALPRLPRPLVKPVDRMWQLVERLSARARRST